MEMNTPEVDPFSKIADGQPYVDPTGTLYIPLTGDRWELIVDENGTISIGCTIQPFGDRPAQRWIATIGEVHEEIEDHESLVEGINFIRSQGQSIYDAN